ncbi:MAG: MarR family transcriptional regulator [Methanosarcinales archaeon]|nr:MarR family transcriptional regulator [Methanosarcinales archaeon]
MKNMSPVDLGLINEVTNNPDPIIKEIKEKLDIPPSTLTSSINRLEKKGLIRCMISTKDRRSYELQLTDKGEEIQSEHLKVDRMAARKLLESLDSNEERKKN